jgi:hypothetical protein
VRIIFWKKMQKAIDALANNNDPTDSARYWLTAGNVPDWIKKQEKRNCTKTDSPGCSILEFWKCKKRLLAN